jgi:hypothetical protein
METKKAESTGLIVIRYVIIAAVVIFAVWMLTMVGFK